MTTTRKRRRITDPRQAAARRSNAIFVDALRHVLGLPSIPKVLGKGPTQHALRQA